MIGNIEVVSSNERIISIHRSRKKPTKTKDRLLLRAALQINQYLARRRRSLSFPTKQMGTKFQNRVWNYLRRVPYGRTTSYGQIAKNLKTSPRAVGGALGRNNLMMSVPCHRVVSKDGKLTGFTSVGGIKTKKRLLNVEQKIKK
tara:strand:- start:184 stop:615 length:432 start_codon:yes stop_codon:yes gene_type:complete